MVSVSRRLWLSLCLIRLSEEGTITARLLLLIGPCEYETCLILTTRSEAVKLTKQRPAFEVRLENKFTFDKLLVVSVSLLIACIVETSADPDGKKKKKKETLSSHLQNS